jgi:septin 3/9/12
MEDLQKHDIRIYKFSADDEEEETLPCDASNRYHPIFAVSASTDIVTINGRSVRGRSYPWGIVDGKDVTV